MYESIKKFLLIDLPSLDFYPKLALSLVLMSVSLFVLVSMWRDPARASSIDPAAEARFKEGVRSFFTSMGQFAPDTAVDLEMPRTSSAASRPKRMYLKKLALILRTESDETITGSSRTNCQRLKPL